MLSPDAEIPTRRNWNTVKDCLDLAYVGVVRGAVSALASALFLRRVPQFSFEPSVLRLRCIAATHFFEGFLDGELVDFRHLPTSLEDETAQRVVSLAVASRSALVLTGFARLHLDEAASLGEGADRNIDGRASVLGKCSGVRHESKEFR